MIIKLIYCVNQRNLNKFITWCELQVHVEIINACIHMRMRHELRRERLIDHVTFLTYGSVTESFDMFIFQTSITLRAMFIIGTIPMFNSLLINLI